MPRFGLTTLNHSPLHGISTQWRSHLDAAAQAGFVALAPDIFWLRALEQEGVSIERIAKEMRARELACMEIAGIAIATVEKTLRDIEDVVRYSDVLGAEFVNARIVESFAFDANDPVVEAVRACAEAFGRVGTRVALEFSCGSRLRGVADGQRMIEVAGASGLGVTLDTWHFFLAGAHAKEGARGTPDWAALESLPIEWLANVQLSDGVGYEAGRFAEATMNERELPGEGEFDLTRCVRALASRDFDGAIIVEVLNAEWRDRPIDEFACAALDSARRQWEGRF